MGGWGRHLAIVAIAVGAFLLWSVWTIGGYVALAAMSCWYLSFAILAHNPDGLFSKWGGLGRPLAILGIATAAVLLWCLWTISGIVAVLTPIAYFVLMLSVARWQTARPSAAGGSVDITPMGALLVVPPTHHAVPLYSGPRSRLGEGDRLHGRSWRIHREMLALRSDSR